MCQIFGNHWGYAENDLLYKSLPEMISELIHCRANNANFLLNVGPMGNEFLRPIDKAMMLEIGKWIRYNKGFIYEARHSNISVENAILLKGEGKILYAVSEVPSKKDIVHGFSGDVVHVKLDAKIESAVWIDNGEPIEIIDGCGYLTVPFKYGTNMVYRVAEIELDRS